MSDPGPGFRAELIEALAVLNPQLDGLDTLSKAGFSEATTGLIREASAFRETRKGLINDLIKALDVVVEKWELLKAHGHPDLPHSSVSEAISEELKKEQAAIAAAMAIFEAQLRATRILAKLGEATPKDT